MKEKDFIKLYKNNRGLKNLEEAKEKIETFWTTLFTVLEEEEKITFKGWGIQRKKEMNSRKVILPKNKKTIYTTPKTVIKFRAGKELKESMVIENE